MNVDDVLWQPPACLAFNEPPLTTQNWKVIVVGNSVMQRASRLQFRFFLISDFLLLLIFIGLGGKFDRHIDTLHASHHYATLIVALPITYEGGTFVLDCDGMVTTSPHLMRCASSRVVLTVWPFSQDFLLRVIAWLHMSPSIFFPFSTKV